MPPSSVQSRSDEATSAVNTFLNNLIGHRTVAFKTEPFSRWQTQRETMQPQAMVPPEQKGITSASLGPRDLLVLYRNLPFNI